ncbi:DUF898 family protein [Inquilinus sp. Marseille-Q2685]|uniref:DUF898 family protein n=1 Tax=Inquilinus sp. Marseille-Q2685 TaxID=2866581 RepID=UPI002104828A|nr:DUF898 family protein [Inquilinus sp. Marseille-Q2685]
MGYDGSRFGIGGLFLKTMLLSVVTLGIYNFWGRTQIRRAIWGAVSVDGEPFEYTGTGKELFFGFLKAIALLIGLALALLVIGYVLGRLLQFRAVLSVAVVAFYLVVSVLAVAAVYLATRYRLSRTLWRSIRFGLDGTAGRFVMGTIGYSLLTLVTLGICLPLLRTWQTRTIVNNARYGTVPFRMEAQGAKLIWPWVLTMLLAVPTLGIMLVWYRVREFRYWSSTVSIAGLKFEGRLRLGQVLGPAILLAVITVAIFAALLVPTMFAAMEAARTHAPPPPSALTIIGIWLYVALAPAINFVVLGHPVLKAGCETMAIGGALDLEAVAQSSDAGPRTGEGLFALLDGGGL